jgi:hypothetical protein
VRETPELPVYGQVQTFGTPTGPTFNKPANMFLASAGQVSSRVLVRSLGVWRTKAALSGDEAVTIHRATEGGGGTLSEATLVAASAATPRPPSTNYEFMRLPLLQPVELVPGEWYYYGYWSVNAVAVWQTAVTATADNPKRAFLIAGTDYATIAANIPGPLSNSSTGLYVLGMTDA